MRVHFGRKLITPDLNIGKIKYLRIYQENIELGTDSNSRSFGIRAIIASR